MRTPRPLLASTVTLVVALASCTPGDDDPAPEPTATASSPEAAPSSTPTLSGPVDGALLVRATVAEVFEVATDEVHVHLVGGPAGAPAGTPDCEADGAAVPGATPRDDGRDLVPGAFFDGADADGSPWTVHVRGYDADDAAAAVVALDDRAEAAVACGAHALADGATATWSAGPELGDHRTWALVVEAEGGTQAGALLYAEDSRGGVLELTVSQRGSDDPAAAADRLETLLALVADGTSLPPSPADEHVVDGLPTPAAVELVALQLPGAADPAAPLAGVLEARAATLALRDGRPVLNGLGPQAAYALSTVTTSSRRPWVLVGAADLAVPRGGAPAVEASWSVQVHLVPDADDGAAVVRSLTGSGIGADDTELGAVTTVDGYTGTAWELSSASPRQLRTIGSAGPFVLDVQLSVDAETDAVRTALEATVRQLLEALAAA